MRTKASTLNLITAWLGQLAGMIVQFVARSFFVHYLSVEYLGLSGLFSNILSMLCLAELGVGTAMTYSLYKPLAQKDIKTIKSLMNLYKKVYCSIGSIILILGILTIPIYPFFISETPNIPHLNLIYFLFVFNTGISYFYSYKRSLISCDQKRYIDSIVHYICYLICNILQIIVLIITQNYILFLVCQILSTVLENIILAKKADKMYPYLKEKEIAPIDEKELSQIKRNVGAMIFHKIGGIVVNSTDNLLISKFVSLAMTGLYSNYFVLLSAVNGVFSQVFVSITAGIGNLNTLEDSEKMNDVFNKTFFLNFWIYGFCTVCLYTLLQPFIQIWIGEKFLLDNFTVAIIVLNFYLAGMRKAVISFRDATGTYYYDRYKPLAESVINLIMSLILVQFFGITGIFLGTTISTVSTCMWIEPYVLYKYALKKPVQTYFKKYLWYTTIVLFTIIVVSGIGSLFQGNICFVFAVRAILCVFAPNIIFFIMFYKTNEFKYFSGLFLGLIKKIKK